MSYTKAASTLFGLTYNYADANGNKNGQILGITDNVDNGRSVTYTYDPLNRLASAVTTGSAGFAKWGLGMSYDRYGNRTAQSVTAGVGVPSNVATIDPSTNHILDAPFAYDANGNLTNDGSHPFTYDGENRAISTTGMTYSYDGNGLRVKKASATASTVYIFSGPRVIAEYDNGVAVASPSREYIYSGGHLVAKVEGGAAKYYLQDHLNHRLLTDAAGSVISQVGSYPYGENWYQGTDKWAFTNYERDPETGNDYADLRYYSNRIGRFAQSDKFAGVTSDPQSLNSYSYVRNDPVNLVDPLGLVTAVPIIYPQYTCRTVGYVFGFQESNDLPVQFCSFVYLTLGYLYAPDDDDRIARAKKAIQKILKGDNDCAKFFNGADSVKSEESSAAAITDKIDVQRGTIPPTFAIRENGVTTYPTDAINEGSGSSAKITVQATGAFFSDRVRVVDRDRGFSYSVSLPPVAGYNPNSLGLQVLILLHEYAHALGGLIKSDSAANDPTGRISKENTEKIIENCKDAIEKILKDLAQ